MAAKVLPPSSGGSFLDSPVFNHSRAKPPPTGLSRRENGSPVAALRFDTSDVDEEIVSAPYSLFSQLNTPDSGFSGAASSTPLKTPESEFSSAVATPPSGGNGQRKRKTVTIDESQTSVVVISPDDLFITYSTPHGQSQSSNEDFSTATDLQGDYSYPAVFDDDERGGYVVDNVTGWPMKRSESLESRDNPFLPGGELSREAEDLLSKATIIRDHFYLNEDERRTLRDQQLRQQLAEKHVHIADNQDHHDHCSNAIVRQPLSLSHTEVAEDRIPLTSAATLQIGVSPTSSPNGANGSQLQPRENGMYGECHVSPDNFQVTVPEDETQPLTPDQTETGPTQPLGLGDLQVHDADKKSRNKCCSLM